MQRPRRPAGTTQGGQFAPSASPAQADTQPLSIEPSQHGLPPEVSINIDNIDIILARHDDGWNKVPTVANSYMYSKIADRGKAVVAYTDLVADLLIHRIQNGSLTRQNLRGLTRALKDVTDANANFYAVQAKYRWLASDFVLDISDNTQPTGHGKILPYHERSIDWHGLLGTDADTLYKGYIFTSAFEPILQMVAGHHLTPGPHAIRQSLEDFLTRFSPTNSYMKWYADNLFKDRRSINQIVDFFDKSNRTWATRYREEYGNNKPFMGKGYVGAAKETPYIRTLVLLSSANKHKSNPTEHLQWLKNTSFLDPYQDADVSKTLLDIAVNGHPEDQSLAEQTLKHIRTNITNDLQNIHVDVYRGQLAAVIRSLEDHHADNNRGVESSSRFIELYRSFGNELKAEAIRRNTIRVNS